MGNSVLVLSRDPPLLTVPESSSSPSPLLLPPISVQTEEKDVKESEYFNDETLPSPPVRLRIRKERVCASMYADPLHVGHLEYLSRAKELAGPEGELVVIVNNDHQARLKKGRPFMPDIERKTILEHLRMVDEVWISIDEDRTVQRTIRSIDPPITMFVNGGDQTNETIPERTVCEELGILLVDGLGEKIQSSSQLTGLVALPHG